MARYLLNLAWIGRSKGLIKFLQVRWKSPMVIQTLQSLFVSSNTRQTKPLITVTMSDKNPDHEMVFANREDFFKSTDPNDVVLDGNLSPFEGAYSNDTYERKLQLPVFKLYGYTPEEYYQNKTNAFPSIVNGETGWTFWSGGTRASYLPIKKKSPRSEKVIMKFISLGPMRLRSKGKSKPCTWFQRVWQVLTE